MEASPRIIERRDMPSLSPIGRIIIRVLGEEFEPSDIFNAKPEGYDPRFFHPTCKVG
jgi:hypothetical protein